MIAHERGNVSGQSYLYTVWLACVFTPQISSPRALFGFVFIHMTACTGPAHVDNIYSRRASSEASFPHEKKGPSHLAHLVPDNTSFNSDAIVKWVWNDEMFVTCVLAAIASRGAFAPTVSAATSPASTFEPPRAGRVLVQFLEGWLWSKLPGIFFIQDDVWNWVLIPQGWVVGCRDLNPTANRPFLPLPKHPMEYFMQHATTPAWP